MKYRKIPGVSKSICTCEQKIAYNLAFRAHISHGDQYQQLPTAAKLDAVAQLTRESIRRFASDELERYGRVRYDVDAIFCALFNGLGEYLDQPFIASDYEQIGAAFPAFYQEVEK